MYLKIKLSNGWFKRFLPMSNDKEIVIKVENLSKKFCKDLRRSMIYGTLGIAKNMLGIRYANDFLRENEFWALNDINFELRKGEALGIIGHNGSGKTTLLRLINGIFPPDKGKITVRGKIGALIAIGAGFHPHMSGRENIYLNGTILGMPLSEIKRKLDTIIEFADIGEFIDSPVATYSSGMTVRLGFSIAVHSEADILVADEVLAVGDLQFALKCYRKIEELRSEGSSIVLVSHGVQLIRNSCQKTLWLDWGNVKEYGDSSQVCDNYEKFMLRKDIATIDTKVEREETILNYDPLTKVTKVEFLGKGKKKLKEYLVGEEFRVRIYFDCRRKVEKPVFTVSFFNPENIQVISNYTIHDKYEILSIEGRGYLDFIIDKLNLKPANYTCMITFAENNDVNKILEWHEKSYTFSVAPNGYTSFGIVNAFAKWDLNK